MSRRDRQVIEARFESVKRLIAKVVSRFCRAYGVEYGEAWGVAGLAFMQAHKSYRRRYGAFTTWVHWKVEMALKDVIRERRIESVRIPYADVELDLLADCPPPPAFDEEVFLERVSRDGGTVATLVLDPPYKLRKAVKGRKAYNRVMRQALVKRLRRQGWSQSRIRRAFISVKRSL